MSSSPTPSSPRPLISSDGTINIVRIGMKRGYLRDTFHFLLRTKWRWLVLMIAAAYLLVNVLFALLYLAGGDCIDNARPGSFADAFFFSVQTMGTIGYGKMTPATLYANVLVTIEAFTGMIGVAMATGLMFTKFALPTSRVLFSRNAVVGTHDGQPVLMFRMANARGNRIMEARLAVTLSMDEMLAEGGRFRRFHDMKLIRDRTPMFALSWSAIHPLTPDSPFYGKTPEMLAKGKAQIIVILAGTDETLSQTVHARNTYDFSDIVWGAKFVDIMSERPDGLRVIDYTKFHDVERVG